MRRLFRFACFAALAPVVAYLTVALVGGLLPVHRGFVPTSVAHGGVPVYLRTNGVHADLVLPAAWPAAGDVADWLAEFPLERIVDPPWSLRAWNWIAFGWGDRGFYLNTPRWRDVRASTAWLALSGQGSAAMHVEYVDVPERYLVQRVEVGLEQYRCLVGFIGAAFVRDATQAPLRIEHPGYGPADAFYEAHGRYTPWFTSNEWVRDALAFAGVRTAWWSPFDAALFWHLPAAMAPSPRAATIRFPRCMTAPGRCASAPRGGTQPSRDDPATVAARSARAAKETR